MKKHLSIKKKKISRKNLLKVLPLGIFSLSALGSFKEKKTQNSLTKNDSTGNKKNHNPSPEYVFEYKSLVTMFRTKIYKESGYRLIKAEPAQKRIRLAFEEDNGTKVIVYIGQNKNEKHKGSMMGKYLTLIETPDSRLESEKRQAFGSLLLEMVDRYEVNRRSLMS